MRDWNDLGKYTREFDVYVWILPMRDWNLCSGCKGPEKCPVWILPMRDWNPDGHILPFRQDFCLDLTYEGLKHKTQRRCTNEYDPSLDLTYEGLKLFLIPSHNCDQSPFGSYLWGIETAKVRLACMKGVNVWILPMRDWNNQLSQVQEQSPEFGSYLWGIETPGGMWNTFSSIECLDLTYEGLKRRWCHLGMCVFWVWILPMRDWNWAVWK